MKMIDENKLVLAMTEVTTNIAALAMLLESKGIITSQEFFDKQQEVRSKSDDYKQAVRNVELASLVSDTEMDDKEWNAKVREKLAEFGLAGDELEKAVSNAKTSRCFSSLVSKGDLFGKQP